MSSRRAISGSAVATCIGKMLMEGCISWTALVSSKKAISTAKLLTVLVGDTFRWKSENVSTNEVGDVLGTFEEIAEANVYGVAVPNSDGRCGCATIVLKEGITPESLDVAGLGKFVLEKLPRYAVPYFLRVTPQLSYTGTFKVQKGQAKREGVDLDLIEKSGSKDKVFWLPPDSTSYLPYSRSDWDALKSGKVKL